ncbi:MAG: cytochrome C biogenesis protein [Sphingomonas fennica]
MTGWLIFAVLALAVGAGLWRFGRPGRGAAEMIAAALLVAAAGYAWQGSPGQPGARPQPRDSVNAGPRAFRAQRAAFGYSTVGADADILAAADSLAAQGAPDYAVATLRAGLNARPGSSELWTGLADALVAAADGIVTPAADFAFRRAERLNPDNPAPRYFRSIALVEQGDIAGAEAIWRDIVRTAPERAPYRLLVGRNLMILDMMRQRAAAGAGGAPR